METHDQMNTWNPEKRTVKSCRNEMMIFALLVLVVCVRVPTAVDIIKYTEEDLIQLSDSQKSIYYDDAAYLEFIRLSGNPETAYSQVTLDKNEIDNHYDNLIFIYNNCFSVSNSFFENISEIHTWLSHTLYSFSASIDTGKGWVQNWINGGETTGIQAIDSVIKKIDLEVSNLHVRHNRIDVQFKSSIPINYVALIKKLEDTGEFRYIEPDVVIGGGHTITCVSNGICQIYNYTLRWGDCPSGCLYSHSWIVRVADSNVTLVEEVGDSLP